MLNKEVFEKDPTQFTIPNDGTAKVFTPRAPQEWRVLRYELSSFVCEGEYERGLERIFSTYLANLDKLTQPAVWVSGFYGSGKSHLVRVLEYLWRDVQFDDGVAARSLVTLPADIKALLTELTTAGKREGGLWSAAGKLSSGGESIRLALLSIMLTSAGLPEKYAPARFVVWLKQNGYYEEVEARVQGAGKDFHREVSHNLYMSPVLTKALFEVVPDLASNPIEVGKLLREQYPNKDEITDGELLDMMESVLELQSTTPGKLPCTLIVLDELQQFLGDDTSLTQQVQDTVEACSSRFRSQLLFVATGQASLQATGILQKLRDRFTVQVTLSDKDVEQVVREVVLRKRQSSVPHLRSVLDKASGEIDRHLVGSRIGATASDTTDLIPDYPLLPVRRRFWERVLRVANSTGTTGQLRTQLRAVHDATKGVAEKRLGHVVAGDMIFDQLRADMLQTNILSRDMLGLIEQQNDGTPDGRLRARLCAAIFLISQLHDDGPLAANLKATPSTLADLLVEDLLAGSASLRQRIPELLHDLSEPGGPLMFVEGEYRLQTKESSDWENDYRQRLSRILSDDGRITADRAAEFKRGITDALKGISTVQGVTKTVRKHTLHFGSEQPAANTGEVPVWVRDEWSVTERTVREDAVSAGVESPIVFVLLPRQNADALKQALASYAAARETFEARVPPNTTEGMEARNAMQSRMGREEGQLKSLVQGIIRNARVYQGGGNEIAGADLQASVKEALDAALVRLFPRFDMADRQGWDTVLKRASDGAPDAISALGFAGEVDKHPVCQMVRAYIGGAGKSGSDIQKHFMGVGFGWPRDAVDGALLALVAGGFVRASRNGQELTAKQIPQNQIGTTQFFSEEETVSVIHHIGVRKLLTDMGLPFKLNEEREAISAILQRLLDLAATAGGEPPVPARPSTTHIQELASLGGNRQFIRVYEQREELLANHRDWTRAAKLIEERMPRWSLLLRLLAHADGLPVAEEVRQQVEAVKSNRSLLEEPDPVTTLIARLTQELRAALQSAHQRLSQARQRELETLQSSEEWQCIDEVERARILKQNSLGSVDGLSVGTDEELLATLDTTSLASWDNTIAALPTRVADARDAAVKLVLRDAVRVSPPQATLRTDQDMETYLEQLRAEIMKHITEGKPVII